ncbi:hypothetical protein [uncultured Chitinophaga sp.]|uniref:hypothetical protein n=1 Tax=uncultured Chitinophaga sp. TaxID=339340 RepID=UPI0025F5AA98|nr:hypothetical protein [uncultured Chitinophaga sp.]
MVNVYTDTSVIGGCFDVEFKEWSQALFKEFASGAKTLILSESVIFELEGASDNIKGMLTTVHSNNQLILPLTEEVKILARTYINEGALSNKSYYDALHIAYATICRADVLASWNFKHIVNLNKIRLYNAINERLGYQPIEIRTPREILNTE